MNTLSLLVIVIGLVVVVAVAAALVIISRRRRSHELRDRYCDEYTRTVQQAGGVHRGEVILEERERRIAGLDIRPLAPGQREAFISDWLIVQAMFVDDPAGAVNRADVLLADVMGARGYPVADFEQRYDDLSVDHAEVVAHYRTANTITKSHARGQAGTEQLRRAMIHYRTLFDDLVNEPEDFSPVIENRQGRIYDLRKESTRRP